MPPEHITHEALMTLTRARGGKRIPGWRGWFNPAENLLRIITGIPEPWYSRAYWLCRGVWFVRIPEAICSVRGHKPKPYRYGVYCERCADDL